MTPNQSKLLSNHFGLADLFPIRLVVAICGTSEKITVSAGKVLGVAYGGNVATATSPFGTRFKADPEGWPPPPGVPGAGFPGGTV